MHIIKNRRKNRTGAISGRSRQEDFARPNQPIRVILARDEEEGISRVGGNEIEEDEPKNLPPPPPAYGLWRGSMVGLAVYDFCIDITNRLFSRELTQISCIGSAMNILLLVVSLFPR